MHLLDYLKIFDSALQNKKNKQVRTDQMKCRSKCLREWLDRKKVNLCVNIDRKG